MENNTRPNPDGAQAGTPNGAPEQQADGTGAAARQQAIQRAEELADRWGEQVGQVVSSVGHAFLRWAARAREEAEDIWAEAQAIRQRKPSANDQPEVPPPANG
jgi:uncharacterized protein YggE